MDSVLLSPAGALATVAHLTRHRNKVSVLRFIGEERCRPELRPKLFLCGASGTLGIGEAGSVYPSGEVEGVTFTTKQVLEGAVTFCTLSVII
jgi:hypothetical protein